MSGATATVSRWSAQQEQVFDWFKRKADGHLVVRARAGTGKTTTIIEGITHAPEARILLAAFAKDIQVELANRLTNPNATALTLHSVGFACVRRFWENIRVDEHKRRAPGLAERVCGAMAPDPMKRLVAKLMTLGREICPHAREVGQLTDLALAFECVPDDDWTSQGFDLYYVETMALAAMELAATEKPVDGIDYADMLYLPVRNQWMVKQYDLVVVDEAQDMTVTQLEIARGVCGGRVCVVGDDRQAIYAFRGADATSLDRLKAELNAEECGLTVTYRCPANVVALAKALVPDIEAAPTAKAGTIRSLQTLDAMTVEAQPGNFILSRTNAPLAKVAMAMIRANKRVKIRGRDFGAGLVALVRKLMKGKGGASIPAFLAKVVAWESREVDRAYKADREELADGIRDKAETLRVLCDGVAGPQELVTRLEFLFSDKSEVGTVICSSVHKAKGLEADTVYILRPTLYPMPPPRRGQPRREMTAARLREEQNIEYVAITRAKDTLVWVNEK